MRPKCRFYFGIPSPNTKHPHPPNNKWPQDICSLIDGVFVIRGLRVFNVRGKGSIFLAVVFFVAGC